MSQHLNPISHPQRSNSQDKLQTGQYKVPRCIENFLQSLIPTIDACKVLNTAYCQHMAYRSTIESAQSDDWLVNPNNELRVLEELRTNLEQWRNGRPPAESRKYESLAKAGFESNPEKPETKSEGFQYNVETFTIHEAIKSLANSYPEPASDPTEWIENVEKELDRLVKICNAFQELLRQPPVQSSRRTVRNKILAQQYQRQKLAPTRIPNSTRTGGSTPTHHSQTNMYSRNGSLPQHSQSNVHPPLTVDASKVRSSRGNWLKRLLQKITR